MASTSQSHDKLTSKRAVEDELEVLENGGLSPQPSLRTEDDACSEIIRIEQQDAAEEKFRNTTLGRIVRTLQVRSAVRMDSVSSFLPWRVVSCVFVCVYVVLYEREKVWMCSLGAASRDIKTSCIGELMLGCGGTQWCSILCW